MNAVLKPAAPADSVITDISLADWGRKEIRIAETEMPGLMRRSYSATWRLTASAATRTRCSSVRPVRPKARS